MEKQRQVSTKEIFEMLVEVRNEIKHLTQRMDTRVTEISALGERVKSLEIKLAVNDQLTTKNSGWIDYCFKGVLTLLAGYIAVRIGLK